MFIYSELLRHKKLEQKRDPDANLNKAAQIVMLLSGLFWIGYLLMLGVMLPLALEGFFPAMEPYHMFNQGLVFLFALDFLFRFTYQKAPSYNIKGYILYPISTRKLVNFMIATSVWKGINLIWLFLVIPFIYLSTIRFFGVAGTLHYTLCFTLLVLCNDLFFSITKMLMTKSVFWILLPLCVFGGIAGMLFVPWDGAAMLYMNFGEGMIEGSIWAYAAIIALLAALWKTAHVMLGRSIREEIAKEEKTKVLKISEYGYMDKFGEIGEFMKLELKMLLRNKQCRTSLFSGIVFIVMFSVFIAFDVYDSVVGVSFIGTYNFVVLGIMLMGNIMGAEGKYIDGLMVRKDSILTILKAKYTLYSLFTLLPFVCMIPLVFMDKISFLSLVGFMLFTCGPIYFCVMQYAVYNRKTIHINQKTTMKGNGANGTQLIINAVTLILPMTVYSAITMLLSETASALVMSALGLAFILTSNLWIRNIYRRFNKRKYTNLEGFRATR